MTYSRQFAADEGIKRERLMDEAILARIYPQELALMGLRHFLAPLGAEKLSGQGKEVDDLKTPETLVNTRFMQNRKVLLCLGLNLFLPQFLSKSHYPQ